MWSSVRLSPKGGWSVDLPRDVGAGGQEVVEHGQAGIADEIGEAHFDCLDGM